MTLVNPPPRMGKFLSVLDGKSHDVPPVWIMRQAGRYLPEYKATRKKAGGFLDLCYTPELALEVTMQPIRRFDFDAAILFSDILVIPDALGQDVRFEEGRGPVLKPVTKTDIAHLKRDSFLPHLKPVIEAVTAIRSELCDEKALIGFCGAPWTVATYMIAGHGTPDQAPARLFALKEPRAFEALMDTLVEASITYLVAQLKAGADVVQIFDTWSGVLDRQQFVRWCVEPVSRIVAGVRQQVPDARISGFPKGAGLNLETYVASTGVDLIGLDWTVPIDVAQKLQKSSPVQGNLDPMRLIAGGSALDDGVDAILEGLGKGPLIFNLGHGITPETPIAHVEQLIARLRQKRS